MSCACNLGVVRVNEIDHFLLVAITLLVTSSQNNYVCLLKRIIEVVCIFYVFQSLC